VKLLDASDGRLRASYPIVDHRERFIAPHSLAFNLTADKLYCGFEDAIEIFDIQQPGEGDRLPTTPSKKSKDGLKGIISSIAFSSSYDYYAIGSLTPSSQAMDNIALYSESNQAAIMPIGGAYSQSGVTQLKFNPTRPHILYAAFRRHDAIYAWDLRSDTSVPVKVFGTIPDSRKTLTNQKIEFDIDCAGRWLSVGDQNGCISIFDLGDSDELDSEQSLAISPQNIGPKVTFNAHGDVVGCVAFQPLHSNLLSASGSRHFDEGIGEGDSDSSDGDSTDQESDSGSQNMIAVSRRRPLPYVKDSSLKLWSFDPTQTVHHA
jgi:WD40 repeat protein